MKIGIGNDHSALELKAEIIELLKERGHEVVDYGTNSPESCDYPVYGEKVGRAVASGEVERGILICGTGLGISLAANKVKGVRAAVCSEPFTAKMSRAHNNCNILAFGARVVGAELAKMIVETWLDTEFEGGRHQRRVDMLMDIENRNEYGVGMNVYTLSQWLLFFFLYSFFGWIWESCYVSLREHRWVNRGFMHGPMLPLYGSGAVSVLIITLPVRDNLPLVFIMGMIGATLLEFFTGMVMESLFHVRYWDYSHLKFNVKGYICPVASLCWGVFSIMMVKVVHIPIEEVILKIPMAIADGLAFVLTVVAAVDFTQSFNEAMDMKKMLAQLDETKVQIRKLQERIREASEDMSEKLRTAAGEVPEKLRSAAATAGEMPGRLRTAAGDRSEKLRTAAGNRSEKFRTAAGDVPEKLRLELAELKENAAKELQKILSRSDETHAGAMKQLRRNPTAASSRFKDVLEELKKYTEKDK